MKERTEFIIEWLDTYECECGVVNWKVFSLLMEPAKIILVCESCGAREKLSVDEMEVE